ncbi:GNAT family N-acetyltransferase [Georgenia alba]|uniref:GNAT family N-acetyltransferase n=1 Tax=Georgenia alba TaxID=2233858 RepID=A0ABW2Q8C3_9MICO
MLTLEEIWPPYAVRLTCGDLELRVVRESDVPELVDLVLDGVHPPEEMPFYFPWTDAPREELPANYLKFISGLKANFDHSSPSLEFVVRRGGEVVGMQGFGGKDFAVARTGETGSWLAMRHQGQGVGTRTRQMICAFAFDVLGAQEVTSAAFVDNPASLAVSRKVGYRDNGTRRLKRRDELAVVQDLVLTPSDFVRGEPVTVEGAEPLLEFLGLTG